MSSPNIPCLLDKIEPNKKVLVTVFPHGLFTIGFFIAGGGKAGTSFFKLVSSIIISIPVIRDWGTKIDFIAASKKIMSSKMKQMKNLILIPGGFNEIFMMREYEYNLFIPTGFIAMSIKNEYTIYPVLALGENELIQTLHIPKCFWKSIIKFMRIFPIPICFPYSARKVPVITYYGTPIICCQTDNVMEVREKIINCLTEIFHNNIKTYCEYRNSLGIKPIVEPSMYSINFYGA
jgi:hypothetical protein